MPVRLVLAADDYNYTGPADFIAMNEQERQIVSTLLAFALMRQAWEPIDDSTWDTINALLADLQGRIDG